MLTSRSRIRVFVQVFTGLIRILLLHISISTGNLVKFISQKRRLALSAVLLVFFILTALPATAQGSWVDCNNTSDGIDPGDCAVLVDMYNSLGGPNYTGLGTGLHAWFSNDAPCSWLGITCSGSGRITEIDVQISDVSGAVPSSIGNLTELQVFNANLTGITSVPPEIGNLSKLTTLVLKYTQITSWPSEIGNLTNLQNLYLGNNGGTNLYLIPTWIGNLSSLRLLGLYDGGFYGGIPTQLCNLTSLESLGLNTNNLSGTLPTCLVNLTNLLHFAVHNNPNITATDPVLCAFLASIPTASWDAGVCPTSSAPPPPSSGGTPGQPSPSPNGNRLNPGSLDIAIFCADNGVVVYTINPRTSQGEFSVFASMNDISAGLVQARNGGQHVQIASGSSGTGLWALASSAGQTPELQATVRGTSHNYDFIFYADTCGAINWQIATPTAITTNPILQTGVATSPGDRGPSLRANGTFDPATRIYTVALGDNLFRISIRFGVSMQAIANANGVSDPTRIFANQSLRIP